MNIISGIDITASALNAQKTRLDIIAQNIANAQTTRTPSGGPYKRQLISFQTELLRQTGNGEPALRGVQVSSISADPTPGERIYNPQHPDADGQGIVTMPFCPMPARSAHQRRPRPATLLPRSSTSLWAPWNPNKPRLPRSRATCWSAIRASSIKASSPCRKPRSRSR